MPQLNRNQLSAPWERTLRALRMLYDDEADLATIGRLELGNVSKAESGNTIVTITTSSKYDLLYIVDIIQYPFFRHILNYMRHFSKVGDLHVLFSLREGGNPDDGFRPVPELNAESVRIAVHRRWLQIIVELGNQIGDRALSSNFSDCMDIDVAFVPDDKLAILTVNTRNNIQNMFPYLRQLDLVALNFFRWESVLRIHDISVSINFKPKQVVAAAPTSRKFKVPYVPPGGSPPPPPNFNDDHKGWGS